MSRCTGSMGCLSASERSIMAGVNKVILIGNLGQDPEVRMTNSGTPVCELRLACTDRRRTQDGQWEDQTEWVTVVTFGRTAENAGKFLSKGRSVYVEGRMQTRSWDDQEGKKRYKTEVVAQIVQFLGGRGESDGYSGSSGGGYGGGQQGGGYGGGQQGGGYGGYGAQSTGYGNAYGSQAPQASTAPPAQPAAQPAAAPVSNAPQPAPNQGFNFDGEDGDDSVPF